MQQCRPKGGVWGEGALDLSCGGLYNGIVHGI